MKNYEDKYNSICDQISVSSDFAESTAKRIFMNNAAAKSKSSLTHKRLVTLAAAVLAVILFAGSVYAVGYIRRARMSDETMFSTSADNYTLEVSQSIEHDGLSVSLSEVIFENNKLYVLFNFEISDADEIAFISGGGGTLSMDGEIIPLTYIETVSTSGGTFWLLREYDFSGNVKPQGAHEFSVVCGSFELFFDGNQSRIIDGPWNYNFTLDVSSLDRQTAVYSINKELVLPNGDIITIDSIVCTPLSQRLCYTVTPADGNELSTYRMYADAYDDLGNTYEFTFHEGRFYANSAFACESVNIQPDNYSADARIITLSGFNITDRYDNILITSDEQITASCSEK